MNHDTTDALRRAACMELPLVVIDKYFGASPQANPFEHQTAKAICRRCVAQVACLTDAIGSPAVFAGSEDLVRGGESGATIRELRRKHFLGGAAVADLVSQVIEQQPTAPDVGRFNHLRRGQFPDAVLATEQESGDE
jgi:hypothetical protein